MNRRELVGFLCKKWRKSNGLRLKDIAGEENVKVISAFESGRSSNFEHYFKYLEKAVNENKTPDAIRSVWDKALFLGGIE